MSGCGPNCGRGCCSDFSSRAERLPNLLSCEVTGGIFAGAIRNMTMRCAQQQAGMMSDEEFEAAKDKLVSWLVITFSGGNKHYETNDEWHEKGGLTDYLAEAFKYHGHSGRQVLTHAASLFAEDAENLAREITHRGGLSNPDAQQAINHLAGMWGQLFTGAPLDFESFG